MANAGDKRLVKSKSGLRIVNMRDDVSSPFLIPEPNWVPDNEYGHCMQCQGRFALMNRRHHCRRCGRLFCSRCCENKVALPRMCFVDPVRMCGNCAKVTKIENEFFEKHLKVLLNGSEFHVSDDLDSEISDNSATFLCKLSSDHRFLLFESDTEVKEPLMLDKVENIQILTPGVDPQGNAVGTGVAMTYESENGPLLLRLVVQMSTKKQGMTWIAAMQKAARFLYEKRCQNRLRS